MMKKGIAFWLWPIICLLIMIIMYILLSTGKSLVDVLITRPLNNELKDLTQFAVKGPSFNTKKDLVALTSDGKEIKIINIENYDEVSYDFYNNKLYIYLEKDDEYGIYLINLTLGDGKYLLEKVANNTTKDFLRISSDINVFGTYAYYFTANQTLLYRFDLITKKITTFPLNSNSPKTIMNKKKGLLLYEYNNAIYEYNINLKKTNELFNNSIISFIHNDTIVYRTSSSTDNYTYYYYEYDYNANFAQKLVKANPTGNWLTGTESIYPLGDDYIYIVNESIGRLRPNISNDELIKLDIKTDAIFKVSDTKFIAYSFNNWCDNCPQKIRLVDITTKTYSNINYLYSNNLYIK